VSAVKLAGGIEKALAKRGVRVLRVAMLEPNTSEHDAGMMPVSVIIAPVNRSDNSAMREERRLEWIETVRDAMNDVLRG
jgi:hypothetical protein